MGHHFFTFNVQYNNCQFFIYNILQSIPIPNHIIWFYKICRIYMITNM